MNKKRVIRLTESDLHRVIRRAVYEATKGASGMLLREDHDNGSYVSWAIDKLSSCEAIMSLLEHNFATLRVEVYADEHSGEVADRVMASNIDEAMDFIQQYQGRPMNAFLDFEVDCANVLDLVH